MDLTVNTGAGSAPWIITTHGSAASNGLPPV